MARLLRAAPPHPNPAAAASAPTPATGSGMDLWLAARVGDLERVRYLVEVKGHDVNGVDVYNATPLYNAALCGHRAVVEYLLDHGAVAEEDTYQGERCFYADDLRRLLKSYNYKAAYRSPFLEYLRTTWENRSERWPDVVFCVGVGDDLTRLPCHKAILRTRSEYFRRRFQGRWKGHGEIRVNPSVHPRAFQAILQYLYTGRVELPVALLADCLRISKQCCLEELTELLEQRQLVSLGETDIFSNKRKAPDSCPPIVQEPSKDDLLASFSYLAKEVQQRFPHDADVCIYAGGRYFALHRVVLYGRSDYFARLFTSGFKEGREAGGDVMREGADEEGSRSTTTLPTITIDDISADAFAAVVEYMYSDRCRDLEGPLLLEVLDAATLFLLDGLRNLCVMSMIVEMDLSDIFHHHSLALLYDLPRLEDHCLSLFAEYLDEVIHTPEFEQLVMESAYSIEKREETDSIPFLDDIRFHVSRRHKHDPVEIDRKFHLVDLFLERVGLSA